MALGTVAFTQANENDFSHEPRTVTIYGTLTITSDYAAGGLICNLSTQKWVRTKTLPINVVISNSNGHILNWVPGTTLANGKVQIFTTAATELSDGAVPAAIRGDAAIFCAITIRKV